MKILQKYELKAKSKKSIDIGVGLGDSIFNNQKIITASLDFLKKFESTISFFGVKDVLNKVIGQFSQIKENSQLKFIECQDPERSIIESLNQNSMQAIIRGSLSSTKFLKYLKQTLNIKEIYRLAILETVNKEQFFYAPVGIDECNDLESKITFLENSLREFRDIDIEPKISILSGGRLGDIGRDEKVNQTIQDANKIVELMTKKYPELMISHNEILIENALENQSNLIIAPDGISGNLIYRTLVHLGGGKAYGAIYMGIRKTVIDTSRVGDYSEFYGALVLALALSQ
ncbi:MAG: methanogenesis marker protein Mmp4/MtxX [Candidatus Hermodarchaeota archaeon]